MKSPNLSKPSMTRVFVVGALLCVLLWGYYIFLVAQFYSPINWRAYPDNFLYYMLLPLFAGIYCYSQLHNSQVGKIATVIVPLLVTTLPILILGEDRSKPGVAWLFLTAISLSMYVGEFLAWLFHVSGARHRFYLDELLSWLINTSRNSYQSYVRKNHDGTKEGQQLAKSPDIAEFPGNPHISSVLQVVQDDADAARAHFHTWWTLRNIGSPEFSDVMSDDRYSEFFSVSSSGHYKLIFTSLARLFDRYSTVAGLEQLQRLLLDADRRDLALRLTSALDGKDDLVRRSHRAIAMAAICWCCHERRTK